MTETHGVEKPFQCDVCSKTFLLKWRLKKHELIHTKRTKTCNFFLSKTPCPFSDIWCKFAHENEANKDPIENFEDDDYSLDKNECHLCHLKLSSSDDLWEHVENQHVEYFQGMIEYAADNRSQSCWWSRLEIIVSHRPMVWPDWLMLYAWVCTSFDKHSWCDTQININ